MPKKTAHQKSRPRQKDNKSKLALAVLAAIFLTILIGKAFYFVAGFYRPALDLQLSKGYIWDDGNINVLLNSQKLSLLSYNPLKNRVVVLNVPDQAYMQVLGGRGGWMASSIYNFGQSENPPMGNRMVVFSLSDFLGLPIDGYIMAENKIVEDVRQNPLKVLFLGSTLQTNLNKSEIYRLLWGVSRARFDKVKEIDLEKYLLDSSLADGTKALVADPVKLDALYPNFFEDFIVAERLEIATVNATGYPGLASKAARLIKNIGGNVIITTTSENKSKTSFVEGKDSKTLKLLNQIFNSACLNNPKCDKIDLNDLQIQDRADIVVVLGEDFLSRY